MEIIKKNRAYEFNKEKIIVTFKYNKEEYSLSIHQKTKNKDNNHLLFKRYRSTIDEIIISIGKYLDEIKSYGLTKSNIQTIIDTIEEMN
jgi:hypothetical protein